MDFRFLLTHYVLWRYLNTSVQWIGRVTFITYNTGICSQKLWATNEIVKVEMPIIKDTATEQQLFLDFINEHHLLQTLSQKLQTTAELVKAEMPNITDTATKQRFFLDKNLYYTG